MENLESFIMKCGHRYNFYYDFAKRQVICTTFYRGQTIRSVAQCNPDDIFDSATGRRLAYLRCRQKLLKKKAARAAQEHQKAYNALEKATKTLSRATLFMENTIGERSAIDKALEELELQLNAEGVNHV